jgi:hypothetical protein
MPHMVQFRNFLGLYLFFTRIEQGWHHGQGQQKHTETSFFVEHNDSILDD